MGLEWPETRFPFWDTRKGNLEAIPKMDGPAQDLESVGGCTSRAGSGQSLQWPKKLQNVAGASVAQLDRASDFGSEGCRFKSCRMHHFKSHLESTGWWVPRAIKTAQNGDFPQTNPRQKPTFVSNRLIQDVRLVFEMRFKLSDVDEAMKRRTRGGGAF